MSESKPVDAKRAARRLRRRAWAIVAVLAVAAIVLIVFRHLKWISVDDVDLVLIAFILALVLLPFAKSVTAGPFGFAWNDALLDLIEEEAERKEQEAQKVTAEIIPELRRTGTARATMDGIIVPGSRKELENEIQAVYRDVDRLIHQKARQLRITGNNREIREDVVAELPAIECKEWKAIEDIRYAVLVNRAGVDIQTMRDALAAGYDLRSRLHLAAAQPQQPDSQ